ncbi:hypothetical protein Tco_0520355 [Tanacetum coccineum]
MVIWGVGRYKKRHHGTNRYQGEGHELWVYWWVDPPMCHKALDAIHGLIKARNELEEDLEEKCLLLGEKENLMKKLRQNMVIAYCCL